MTVEEYKSWHLEYYGTKPSERLIESFCRSNGLLYRESEEPSYWVPVRVEMKFGKEAK